MGVMCSTSEEYKTSYWKDFNELRTEGEKLWEAEPKLVSAEEALYMPNIESHSLSKSAVNTTDLLEGHTSLVAIYFNQFGDNHTQTFTRPFLDEFSDHNRIQLMKVNIEVNFAKSLILRLLTPYLKRTIPASLHNNYILLFHDDPSLREALDMNNSCRGYVFLVDSSCKLRWSAHGNATSREIESMLKLVKTLDEQNQSTIK
ncbi:9706_t:CDS:2 [Acaulospora colombiana]|uniref:9706_t:CDS:1 n=1 Tax=Acaulospora colombiana TaxID=27376 RepID=A0ACA9L3E2_9GLOM|nr:9706_t:CDS:2 [Acaulospora colombiana]